MPGLSIYERQGTTAKNNLNAEAIGQYVRRQYANNSTQANLMVMSSILTQNVVARDIIGRNALLQRREAQLKELDDQLTRYYAEFGSVLNDKALDFLNKMADVKVPTFTSILAGFENARASRAENERTRVAEMERLMALDTKLQTERLQLRREQLDNEMLAGQTRIKAAQDLMANTNAVNSEAFKATGQSGELQDLPAGRIYNSPTLNTQPYHTNFVDDRERIYGGKGSKITNVADLVAPLIERPAGTTPATGETVKQPFRLLGDTPGHEFFIRDPNSAAPQGKEAIRYHDLLLNLNDTVEDYRRNSDGNSNYYETLVRENPDYIKALNYVLGTLQGGQGTTGPGLREHLLPQLLPGPDDSDYGKARRRILLPPGERGGWNLNDQAEAAYFLQHIWPQMLHISKELHRGNMKVRAAEQEPAKPDGTPGATKATQGGTSMYFGPEPAARTVVGFNGTGVAPVVSHDGYQNEFAYTAASRTVPVQMGESVVAVDPVQMGESVVAVDPVQMGETVVPVDPGMGATVMSDATLTYIPDEELYPDAIVDRRKEIGDELPQGVSRRRMDSGIWEFTYPDGRKVYSDSPTGPGGIRGEEGQRGSVTEGSMGWRPTGGYEGITTVPREGDTPIYTNVSGGSVLDPATPNPVYRGNAGFSRVGGMNGISTIPREGNTPIYTNVPGGSVLDPRTPNPVVRGGAGWRPTGGYEGITTIPREGNTPIYTNVPGGSVLDSRTPNPVVRGPARAVRPTYNPENYSVRVGDNYYNPFSGEEGTVVGYSQTPGVVRVRRPDGSIYATNIDPNMDMGYVRSDYQTLNAWMPRNQYGGQPYQIGDHYVDGLVSSSQGTIQGGVPGAQVMRVRRPDGSDVYVNTPSYPSYLDEYHPYDRYRPRSNYVNPYTGEWQPPVRMNRY